MGKEIIRCGLLPAELIKRVLGVDVPALPVYCLSERMRHIEQRHPSDVPYIRQAIERGIIQNPDYIGFLKGPLTGYFFVKKLDRPWKNKDRVTVNNALVGVIPGRYGNYYSVITAYSFSDVTVANRIKSGLLKEVVPIQEPAPPLLPPVVSDTVTAAQLLAAQWGATLRRENRNSPS